MINRYNISDIFIGMKYSFKRKLSLTDIDTFSKLTGDVHPLHTDEGYAAQHGFNGVIAHGFLLASYVSYAIGMKLPGENVIILSQSSRFLKPALVDDDLLYKCEVTKMDKRFSAFTIQYDVFNGEEIKLVSGEVEVKLRNQNQ